MLIVGVPDSGATVMSSCIVLPMHTIYSTMLLVWVS